MPGRQPPIAVCVIGEARTLRLPCVHDTWSDRLISPLRNHYGEPVVFVLLRKSRQHGIRWQHNASAVDANGTSLAAIAIESERRTQGGDYIADHEGLRSLLRRAVGPDTQLHLRWIGPESVPNDCAAMSRPCTINRGHRISLRSVIGENLDAYLSQQVGWGACAQAVEAHEAAHGSRFAAVLKSRPDLMWYAPLPRNLKVETTAYLMDRPTHSRRSQSQGHGLSLSDWAWVTPRALMRAAFGFAAEFCARCREAGEFTFTWDIHLTEGLLATRVASAATASSLEIKPVVFPSLLVRENTSLQVFDHQLDTCSTAGILGSFRLAKNSGEPCKRILDKCWGCRWANMNTSTVTSCSFDPVKQRRQCSHISARNWSKTCM